MYGNKVFFVATLILSWSILENDSCYNDAQWRRRSRGSSGVPHPTLLLLIGGVDAEENFLHDITAVRPDGSVCTNISIRFNMSRLRPSAVKIDSGILLCGGYDERLLLRTDCYLWSPGSVKDFLPIGPDIPIKRYQHFHRLDDSHLEKLIPPYSEDIYGDKIEITRPVREDLHRKTREPKIPFSFPTTLKHESTPSPNPSTFHKVASKLYSSMHSVPNNMTLDMLTTTESEKVLKDKMARGSGHLEYGLWQGKTFGKKWGHLTSTFSMTTYTPDDLMRMPKSLQSHRNVFWAFVSHDSKTFLAQGTVMRYGSHLSWREKRPPAVNYHYEDSTGGCPLMAAGRILFLGSTNNQKKGTMYFKDDSGAMLAYTGKHPNGDRDATLYDKQAKNESNEFTDSLALDLGHWSDLSVMTSGMPGTPRDYMSCSTFLSNPVFNGGLSFEGEKYIMMDIHMFNFRKRKWNPLYTIPPINIPRFKHILTTLSDGYKEHLITAFGFTSQGRLTNTIERYIHRFHDPHWVLYEDAHPKGAPAHFASVVIPAQWVPECPVKRVIYSRRGRRPKSEDQPIVSYSKPNSNNNSASQENKAFMALLIITACKVLFMAL